MSSSPSSGDPEVWADRARLMAAAQDGDRVAYARLLKALVPVIRVVARRKISDPSLVEDVVQDTLLAIHRVRHTYDPCRPLLPWVTAIASARAIDVLRKERRKRRREVSDPEGFLAQPDAGALRQFEGFAIARELQRLLALLPGRQRQIVELVRLQDMSVADAAAISGLSVPAAKTLLHRASHALRRHGEMDHD